MLSRSFIHVFAFQGSGVADVRRKNLYKKNKTMDILGNKVINGNDR